jgi:hypothetical protein
MQLGHGIRCCDGIALCVGTKDLRSGGQEGQCPADHFCEAEEVLAEALCVWQGYC